MKLTKEKQQNLILTILVCLGVLYGAWYFGIDRQGSTKARDERSRLELEKKIADTKSAILREKSNRENAKVFQEYILQAESRMPKGNVETWLVKELSEIASRHSLSLMNTAPQEIKAWSDFKMKGQPYVLDGFHVELKGELNQIGAFLQEMENKFPMLEIHDFSLTSGSESGPTIHSVSMALGVARKS